MGKIAALLFAGAGTVAASVGGVYLFKRSTGGDTVPTKRPLFESVGDFESG